MTPIKFEGATVRWVEPPDWDHAEPCADLWTFDDDGVEISCWRPSWRERLAIMFGSPVWLHVVGRQPPVQLTTDFERE